MKTEKILYAGDTNLTTAACYLAGILTHFGHEYDYLASDEPIAPALDSNDYSLFIISDYPAENFTPNDFDKLTAAVKAGAGLIMLGGWESFHGLIGEYNQTPIADILPVILQSSDDRVQSHKPWAIIPTKKHEICSNLEFFNPPIVGGFNKISPKPDANEIMQLKQIDISAENGTISTTTGDTQSLLTVGNFGLGKTAALATDVAPHWVGTFVDWGTPRISAQAKNADPVEIGCHYATFFNNLVNWAKR